MKHIGAILLKYVMIAIILEIVLGWLTDNSFTDILVISAAVTVVSYLVDRKSVV
jgi:low affinity Fe/Cu permease